MRKLPGLGRFATRETPLNTAFPSTVRLLSPGRLATRETPLNTTSPSHGGLLMLEGSTVAFFITLGSPGLPSSTLSADRDLSKVT